MQIEINARPNSTKGPLVVIESDGRLTVYTRKIASDGAANKAIIEILSKYYKIPKTKINIIRGLSSRHKIIEIPIDKT